MAKFWALIQLVKQLVDAIGVFLGLIERAKYEHAVGEINKDTEAAGNPDLPEKGRSEAAKELEDRLNKRT